MPHRTRPTHRPRFLTTINQMPGFFGAPLTATMTVSHSNQIAWAPNQAFAIARRADSSALASEPLGLFPDLVASSLVTQRPSVRDLDRLRMKLTQIVGHRVRFSM